MKDNYFDEIFEITKTIQILTSLMDAGFSISIEQVGAFNDDNILVMHLNEYVTECRRFNDKFCINDRMAEVLSELYISDGDAQKYAVENNGLAYLINKLKEKLSRITHDYKWNFEEKVEDEIETDA